jgi:hypothetical protein
MTEVQLGGGGQEVEEGVTSVAEGKGEGKGVAVGWLVLVAGEVAEKKISISVGLDVAVWSEVGALARPSASASERLPKTNNKAISIREAPMANWRMNGMP